MADLVDQMLRGGGLVVEPTLDEAINVLWIVEVDQCAGSDLPSGRQGRGEGVPGFGAGSHHHPPAGRDDQRVEQFPEPVLASAHLVEGIDHRQCPGARPHDRSPNPIHPQRR
jgi:hypothetical protein